MSGIQFLTRIVSIRFLAPWPMGEGDRLTVHISQSILYTSMFISARCSIAVGSVLLSMDLPSYTHRGFSSTVVGKTTE